MNLTDRHQPDGMRENTPAADSRFVIRRRERKPQQFESHGSGQRFLTCHACVYNIFNFQAHRISRSSLRSLRAQADQAWVAATLAA